MGKKFLIFAGVIILIGLTIVVYFFLRTPAPQPKPHPALAVANNFGREFFTYSYADTADYKKRIAPYLDPSYQQDFFDYFGLPIQANVPANEKGNYSRALKMTSALVDQNNDQTTIKIATERKVLDTLIKPGEFQETKSITVVFIRKDNSWKARKVVFSSD